MTDQLNNEENIDESKTKDGTTTVDSGDLQLKIDNAVKSRLAREKEHQKAMEAEWADEKKALEEENTFLKNQFQAKIDEQLADLPASFRSLVSKLPIREQIQWLEEQKKENEAKPKPTPIPNFNKKPNEKGGDIEHMPIDRFL
jgi:hypothetical protein